MFAFITNPALIIRAPGFMFTTTVFDDEKGIFFRLAFFTVIWVRDPKEFEIRVFGRSIIHRSYIWG